VKKAVIWWLQLVIFLLLPTIHINGDLEFNTGQQKLLPIMAHIGTLPLILHHRNNAKHLNVRA